MKISGSAEEFGSGDDFWVYNDAVFVNDFDSAVVFVRSSFQRQPQNWIPVMISGSTATEFLSMISDYAVLYVR